MACVNSIFGIINFENFPRKNSGFSDVHQTLNSNLYKSILIFGVAAGGLGAVSIATDHAAKHGPLQSILLY